MAKAFLDVIQGITYFNPNELYQIGKAIKIQKLAKNEIFVRPEDIANRLYFIIAGTVREYIIYNEKELNTWIHLSGDVTIASRSFMRGKSAEVFFEAMENTWIASLTNIQAEELEKSIPSIGKVRRHFYEEAIMNFEKRQLLYTILDAKDRLAAFEKMYPRLFKNVADKHIASFLQIHPSTMSIKKGA